MKNTKEIPQFEHFRNAMTQIPISSGSYQGIGIVILDQAQLLIGEFNSGDLHGWYLLIGDGHYAYGTVSRNQLQGYGVIQTKQATIYGFFKNGLLEGVAVIKRQSENRIEIVEYQKGQQVILVDEKPLAGSSLSQLIKKHLGCTLQNPLEFLESKSLDLQKSGVVKKQIGPNLRYFGFCNYQHNLGFIFNNDFLQSFGDHNEKSELNGLGRFLRFDMTIFDGVFQNGQWIDDGVQIKSRNNQSNLPKQIIAFRKQFHLKQFQFNNCHFVLKQYLNIGNIDLNPPQKFSGINQLLKTRSRRTTSSFKQQSPLKIKLKTYQKQASKYVAQQQPEVRSYTRTIDRGRQSYPQTPPFVSQLSISKNKIESPQNQSESQYKQDEPKQQDIYQLVKRMELQQSKKRIQLDQIIRIRTKTTETV